MTSGRSVPALNVHALQRQIELLKEMGCNAIRTSHNPPAPELLELCDQLGMVVMDEAFDCWVRAKRKMTTMCFFRIGTRGSGARWCAATETIRR